MAINIDYSELNNTTSVYGITTKRFLMLYHFFKTHSRDANYVVLNYPEDIDKDLIEFFESYGIYFDKTFNEDLSFTLERQLLIIPASSLSDEITFSNFVRETNIVGLDISVCLIEKDYDNCPSEEVEHDIKLVNKVLPKCLILNEGTLNTYNGLLDSAKAFEKLKAYVNPLTKQRYHFKDVTEIINHLEFADINTYLQCATNAIEEIRRQHTSVNDMFYVDSSLSMYHKQAYYAIAAYLLLNDDIKFHIPLIDFANFTAILDKAKSQNYMFLNDYLHTLADFPSFSISCKSNQCYFWVKNTKALQDKAFAKKYNINLTLFRAQVDTTNWKLIEDFETQSLVVPLKTLIGIKRFRDYCDLGSTDKEAALKSYNKLNSLFMSMSQSLHKKKILPFNETLTINNVLLYEQSGIMYIAYVADINGIIPFVVWPLKQGYTPFTVELSIKELSILHDVKLFYDSNVLCHSVKLQSNLSRESKQYYDKETLKGIIFNGYTNYKVKIDPNSPLTFAEIGVWSLQTGAFRQYLKGSFLDILNKKALIDSEALSIFGFKHPSVSVEFIINNEYWRDKSNGGI